MRTAASTEANFELEGLEFDRVIANTNHSRVSLAYVDGDKSKPVAFKQALPFNVQSALTLGNERRELVAAKDVEGVVDLLAAGLGGDGLPYIVTDYATQGSLSAQPKPTNSTDALRIWEIIRDVAGTVDKIHSRGVACRDIKPDNIVIDGSGKTRLIDFGVASYRYLHPAGSIQGDVIGTLDFLCIERLDAIVILRQSDNFALGATACLALFGSHPWLRPDEDAESVGRRELSFRIMNQKPYIPPRERSYSPPEVVEYIEALLDPAWQSRALLSGAVSLV